MAYMIRLDHTPTHALDFQLEDCARTYPFTYGADDMPDLLRSIERHTPDPREEVRAWAREFLTGTGRPTRIDMLARMNKAIKQNFTYVARDEKGVQSAAETLREGKRHLSRFRTFDDEVQCALWDWPLVSFPAISVRTAATALRHVGGGATHAWLQVYLPGAGWVEYDPTNGIVGNRDLIRVAVVRDPRQAAPLSGTWTGFPADCLGMTVEVRVVAEDTDDPLASASARSGPDPGRQYLKFSDRIRSRGLPPCKFGPATRLASSATWQLPMLLMLSVHPSRVPDLLAPEQMTFDPPIAARQYRDGFGNICTRIVAPPGRLTISGTSSPLHDTGNPDDVAPHAEQHPVEDLPFDTLPFLLEPLLRMGPPGRHCLGPVRPVSARLGQGASRLRLGA